MSKKTAPKKTGSGKPATKPPVDTTSDTTLPPAPSVPTVYVKCRRGSDKIYSGNPCNSLTAENMTVAGSGHSRFRCTKCGYTWSIQTGGTFTVT